MKIEDVLHIPRLGFDRLVGYSPMGGLLNHICVNEEGAVVVVFKGEIDVDG